jgi:hypothetical protein
MIRYGYSSRFLLLSGLLALVTQTACDDFSANRKRYEQTVLDARKAVQNNNQTVYFRTKWNFGHASPEETNVCARMTKEGSLFMRILTRDNHHAGRYGYAYTDPPMTSRNQVNLALDEDGCGEWEHIMKINEFWWKLESHLD